MGKMNITPRIGAGRKLENDEDEEGGGSEKNETAMRRDGAATEQDGAMEKEREGMMEVYVRDEDCADDEERTPRPNASTVLLDYPASLTPINRAKFLKTHHRAWVPRPASGPLKSAPCQRPKDI